MRGRQRAATGGRPAHDYLAVPRYLCHDCSSAQVRWALCSGRGSLYSWTTTHRALYPAFPQTPFTSAAVTLEEGPTRTAPSSNSRYAAPSKLASAPMPAPATGRIRAGANKRTTGTMADVVRRQPATP
ncbi:Zn-ribbon domain-containing OB-fold protein [Kitasatospora sp. NPDC057223]|uniref:Zn-ribbon domain-containing OB-fold protein n=1 Tax=Kitasatospora sp. NPDC057223 TaxID=3346055 RepID=UPI00362C00AD